MKTTISEEKQSTLVDLLRQMENEISILFTSIENDHENIPEDKFREYEQQINKLYAIHNQLSDEVILS